MRSRQSGLEFIQSRRNSCIPPSPESASRSAFWKTSWGWIFLCATANAWLKPRRRDRAILEIAERMLRDAKNLKQVGQEFANEASGSLTIATTHTQARYALPSAIKHFTSRYPKVKLILRQGSPTQIAELVTSGVADIAIATEAIELFDELVMLPCYQWNRCIVVPPSHPLLKLKKLTLEAIASVSDHYL